MSLKIWKRMSRHGGLLVAHKGDGNKNDYGDDLFLNLRFGSNVFAIPKNFCDCKLQIRNTLHQLTLPSTVPDNKLATATENIKFQNKFRDISARCDDIEWRS